MSTLPASSRPGARANGGSASGGFTLIEVMLASLVLAISVLGISQAIVSGQAQSYQAMHESRAVALAEAMMDEVLALPYMDLGGDVVPGPDGAESLRINFDGMDDFDAFAEAAGELRDLAGNLYPASFQRFERRVTAEYGAVDVPALGGVQTGLNVTVTVQDAGGGQAWTLHRFIAEPPL